MARQKDGRPKTVAPSGMLDPLPYVQTRDTDDERLDFRTGHNWDWGPIDTGFEFHPRAGYEQDFDVYMADNSANYPNRWMRDRNA